MIHAGRRRHWRSWLALALIVPAILIAAWVVRQPPPVNDSLPAALVAPPGP